MRRPCSRGKCAFAKEGGFHSEDYVIAGAALISSFFSVNATEHEVKQKGNAFGTSTLKVKVGNAVKFRNDDRISTMHSRRPMRRGSSLARMRNARPNP